MATEYVRTVGDLQEIIEDLQPTIRHDEDYCGRSYSYIEEIQGLDELSINIDSCDDDTGEHDMEVVDRFDDYQTGIGCKFLDGDDNEHEVEVLYDIVYFGDCFTLKNFKWIEV